jgi:hypothetical protein
MHGPVNVKYCTKGNFTFTEFHGPQVKVALFRGAFHWGLNVFLSGSNVCCKISRGSIMTFFLFDIPSVLLQMGVKWL